MSPWRLGGLSPADVARRVHARIWQHDVFDRAASLSYYFLFALFPTLLFLTALLGLLPIPKLMDRLLDDVSRMLPGDASSLVTRTLGEVVKGARGSLVSIGVLAALWGAASGMVSIRTALNVAYDARDRRPWWRQRLDAVASPCGSPCSRCSPSSCSCSASAAATRWRGCSASGPSSRVPGASPGGR